MMVLLIIGLLALNLAISCWNAYAGGALWTEAKAQGGWFKLVIICVAIMAAAGFFQVNVIVFSVLFLAVGWLDQPTFILALKMSYLLLAPTIIGTGLIIWLDSIATAMRERDFLSIGVATWNTYAMYHNVSDAMSTMPGVASDVAEGVGSLFKSEDGAKAAFFLAICAIFILSAVLSFFMVRYFWKWGASTRQEVIQQYVHENRPARA